MRKILLLMMTVMSLFGFKTGINYTCAYDKMNPDEYKVDIHFVDEKTMILNGFIVMEYSEGLKKYFGKGKDGKSFMFMYTGDEAKGQFIFDGTYLPVTCQENEE